jgi:hypothetical protein
MSVGGIDSSPKLLARKVVYVGLPRDRPRLAERHPVAKAAIDAVQAAISLGHTDPACP